MLGFVYFNRHTFLPFGKIRIYKPSPSLLELYASFFALPVVDGVADQDPELIGLGFLASSLGLE